MEGSVKSVDEYLALYSGDMRKLLEQMRTIIRKAAPDAEEVISYQMPAYKQNGILVILLRTQNTSASTLLHQELLHFRMNSKNTNQVKVLFNSSSASHFRQS